MKKDETRRSILMEEREKFSGERGRRNIGGERRRRRRGKRRRNKGENRGEII